MLQWLCALKSPADAAERQGDSGLVHIGSGKAHQTIQV